MAEQHNTLAAPFPAPPPFYKHFTKPQTAQLRQLRTEAASSANDGGGKPALDILSLPPELCYLIPPVPPVERRYQTFGAAIDLNAPDATLEDAGIEQLYPLDPAVILNPQPQLLALARSLLTTFLSLVGVLSQNPTEFYPARVENLQTIMYNIHDLINRYRPHQARESLALMMQERIDVLREETRRIREARAGVERITRGMIEGGRTQYGEHGEEARSIELEAMGLHNGQGESEKTVKQREAWTALDNEVSDAV